MIKFRYLCLLFSFIIYTKPLVDKVTTSNILDKLVDICSHVNLVVKNYALSQKKNNKLNLICDNIVLCCDIQSVLAKLINQIIDTDKNAFLNSANRLEKAEIMHKLKLFETEIESISCRACKNLELDLKILKEIKFFLDDGCFVKIKK